MQPSAELSDITTFSNPQILAEFSYERQWSSSAGKISLQRGAGTFDRVLTPAGDTALSLWALQDEPQQGDTPGWESWEAHTKKKIKLKCMRWRTPLTHFCSLMLNFTQICRIHVCCFHPPRIWLDFATMRFLLISESPPPFSLLSWEKFALVCHVSV